MAISRARTTQGGPANAGTVFTMTAAGAVTVLYAFTGGVDGAYPYGALVQDADGSLLGTTSSGGAGNAGTVFRISSTGNFTVVYTFTAGSDGAYPYAGLLRATDGSLYGTTSGAGDYGAGTVFKLAVDGTFSVVYAFTGGADGGYPYSNLVQGADGRFYGTTYGGGATGYGTIFRLGADGTVATLYAFTGGSDGAYPYGAVAMAADASLYGTAAQGGDYGQGTVFKLAADGTFAVLHAFRRRRLGRWVSGRRARPGARRKLLRHDLFRRRAERRHHLPRHARRDLCDRLYVYRRGRRRLPVRGHDAGRGWQHVRHRVLWRRARRRHGVSIKHGCRRW